jgi:hypothetical protein
LTSSDTSPTKSINHVILNNNIRIPAGQGVYIPANTEYKANPNQTAVLFEPSEKFITKTKLMILPALTNMEEGKVQICLMNGTQRDIMAYKNTKVGMIADIEEQNTG